MPAPLTSNQVRGFWAAWGGWALDGMDSFIYALVLVPALGELLRRSGIAATPATIGYYGSVLFALFVIGWGLSMVWGPLADRFGRVRTLMLTIVCYSLFTLLGAVATSVWPLAIFRLLAGVGIGGEWSMGGTFVAEEWPEDRRTRGAGYMHTGYYFGFFLAALANDVVGARYGWRAMFALGGLPALLVGFIRYAVREPARWEHGERRRSGVKESFLALFSPPYRRRTILNSIYLLVSIIGLWAGSVYVPAAVTQIALRGGVPAMRAARLASYGTMILSTGTILGCVVLPRIADRIGRRRTLGLYFALMFLAIAVGFGYVFYLPAHALRWFFVCLFFLGLGGANFAMYTLWLPEQYPTACRASAFAFATSVGRFAGAGITFLVGYGVARLHTLGTPIALTS
ncbi:MAG: MFS transporter, partial [Acidobacteria bacterium]